MLCLFYELILIVFRTINVNMHLKSRLFNALFNYFDVVKKIIRNNAYSSKTFVIKACELTFTKLAKYYFKIKSKNELIYNLVIILNFTQKLNLYRNWDTKNVKKQNFNKNDHFYYDKYKKEFKNYFNRYYKKKITILKIETQRVNEINKIMQIDNAIVYLLIII